MAAKCCTAPGIIWNWIIEALVNAKQVDTSTMTGLVETTPEISANLGKDAREMISLRILENLFLHGKESTVDTNSGQNAKIGFDPSESSEDVLQRIIKERTPEVMTASSEDVLQQILKETPEVMTELNKEKWDVGPFLMHKCSSFPKCGLEKLKEVVESSHPLLASLKEKSKLATSNASERVGHFTQGTTANEKRDISRFTDPKNNIQADALDGGPSNESKTSTEDDGQLETSSASERYDDERTDIAAKKDAFFNFRCTQGQDSFIMTEINPTPPSSTPKKKRKEREVHMSMESRYSLRLRKGKPQYTTPAGPSLRRNRIPWTKSEEEILKEGMQRYSDANTKGIPWKLILDFGHDVFNKGWTPIDLKDKWRNLCKGNPNLKS